VAVAGKGVMIEARLQQLQPTHNLALLIMRVFVGAVGVLLTGAGLFSGLLTRMFLGHGGYRSTGEGAA